MRPSSLTVWVISARAISEDLTGASTRRLCHQPLLCSWHTALVAPGKFGLSDALTQWLPVRSDQWRRRDQAGVNPHFERTPLETRTDARLAARNCVRVND